MKIIFLSDTHGEHESVKALNNIHNNQLNDFVLIHGGDITENGTENETIDFLQWFAKLPCKHKIFIAGNHDLFLENLTNKELKQIIPQGVTYLNNSSIVINGYTIWGSPVTPNFLGMAFNKERGKAIITVWNKIPSNINILITHGPPQGILDGGFGCEDLLNRVIKIKPSLHLFGHAHEQYGSKANEHTQFINAALVNNKDPMDERAHKIIAKPIEIKL